MDNRNIYVVGGVASGKNTLIDNLKDKLGYDVLDTGQIYRALSFLIINNKEIYPDLTKIFNLDKEEITRVQSKITPAMIKKSLDDISFAEGNIVDNNGNFDDGSIKIKEHYVNGKQDGIQLSYHKNGAIEESMNFIMGSPNGEAMKYDENGDLKHKSLFKNGEEVYSEVDDVSPYEIADNSNYDAVKVDRVGDFEYIEKKGDVIFYKQGYLIDNKSYFYVNRGLMSGSCLLDGKVDIYGNHKKIILSLSFNEGTPNKKAYSYGKDNIPKEISVEESGIMGLIPMVEQGECQKEFSVRSSQEDNLGDISNVVRAIMDDHIDSIYK